MIRTIPGRFFVLLLALGGPLRAGQDLPASLEALRAVGPEGKGNRSASEAWREVSRAGAAELPRVLAAMDGANPLAANWIRTAFEAIAERELARGGKLPAKEIEEFILERRHDPQARRLAFEWLARIDPGAPDRLIPRLEDDPSVEIRRDAVARVLDRAKGHLEKKESTEAAEAFRRALTLARDNDQIKAASGKLRELGQEVDLPRHFGFLMEWKIIGPFDNTGAKAFDTAYPPEKAIDLGADIPGKGGAVRWKDFATTSESGVVDLNVGLGRHKGAIAYALAEFTSGRRQGVELRLGTPNAWKVWLDGKLLFAHEEYHHGMDLDQYVVRGEIAEGRNLILLKLCQNEQTEDFAQEWRFQIRVCDAAGTAVLSTTRPETKKPAGEGPEAAGGKEAKS